MPDPGETTKSTIFNAVGAIVADFTEYERKEDEGLSEAELDAAINAGQPTLTEIVEEFERCLRMVYSKVEN